MFLSLLPPEYNGPRGAFWGENLTKPIDVEDSMISSFLPMLKKKLFSRKKSLKRKRFV